MSLPSGYRRLEYIQSSGTQYIDTGFKPNQNSRIVMDAIPLGVGSGNQGGFLFGSGYPVQQAGFEAYVFSSAFSAVYNGTQQNSSTTVSAGTRLSVDFNKTSCVVKSGSTKILDATFSHATFISTVDLCLLLLPRQSKYYGICKLYACQIYDNGTLIRDFIPCKNASGTIGLWDDVNNKFYANAGTGVFTAGPEVAGTHKALINGTSYDATSGKCLINGTGYAIQKGRTLINGTGYDISMQSGTPLSEIPVGNTVKIAVNGTMRDWIVVNQGIPSGSALYDDSCNGTWLLMKDSYENRWWNNSVSNDYKNSSINSYLNNAFLNLFESSLKSIIQQVKIPYVNGTGGSAVASGANGLACKIFLLSGNEIGLAGASYMPGDGAKLEYFTKTTGADAKRIAYRNGTVSYWYLRSPKTNVTSAAFGVTSSGGVYGYDVYGGMVICDIRPAMILPSDTRVADDGTVLG